MLFTNKLLTAKSHRRAIPALGLMLLLSASLAGPLSAQQLTPDDKALMLLTSAQQAYNDRNYQFATDRFREFVAQYGGHKQVAAARYGLALALLEGPARDYNAALEALQPIAGQQDFSERPFVLYYLGLSHRGIGHLALAQAIAKPTEAAQHRSVAQQRFELASQQFTAAVAAFVARNMAVPAAQDKVLPTELEWLARSRCDQAEMLLQMGKFDDARKATDPVLSDPVLSKSRYRRLAAYYTGQANFALQDYPAAIRVLGPLAPFDDPAFGVHTRYLLGRTHHLAAERPEAALHYEAVVTDYEKLKTAARTALQNPNQFKDNLDEKLRLEGLVNNPPPDYVARAAFFWGILLYEQGKFGDAATIFSTFAQKFPNSTFLKEAELRQGMCNVQQKQIPEAQKVLQPLQDHPQLADQALWWLARAQARSADPNNPNPQVYLDALKAANDIFRRAADRAQQFANADPQAKLRRGEILLELGDTQQLAGQYPEAAATYQQVITEQGVPNRIPEALERQVTAWQLAARYKESDDACARFQQHFPQSTLLPSVLFRFAENAYLVAVAAANTPNLPNRDAELTRLFGEAIKRALPVIEKYPEFEYVSLARLSLATSYYQLGKFPEAIAALEAIPDSDRNGRGANVPYLLADCLIRTLPTDANDALAAAQLVNQLEQAIKLLDGFATSEAKNTDAPDALLKLGFCQQRMAGQMAEPEEQKKVLATARQTYEKLTQQYPAHPLFASAVFERAKCIADAGDPNGAINELNRFQGDPLKQSPIAPMAFLRQATLMRAQNRAADAVTVLAQCRATYEGALANDVTRPGWAALIQYHHALAIKDTGKLPEARAVFENAAKQFPARPEAWESAWRVGQCKREEAQALMQNARKILTKPDVKPEEIVAAQAELQKGIADLKAAAQYFSEQLPPLQAKGAGSSAHLRMLYEAAWCQRALADLEIEATRQQMLKDALQKRQAELAQKAVPGDPMPVAHVPDITVEAVPLQPAEQKARELYQTLITAGGTHLLTLEVRFELAELRARRGETEPAVALLNEALDLEPPAALAERMRMRLGVCYQARGEFGEAFGQFDTIAQEKTSPLAAEARYRAGECLLQQEDWEAAIAQLLPFRDQPALHNIAGISDRALLRLGHAYGLGKQWDASRQTFEMLIGRYGQSPWIDDARYGIGWAQQNQKQYDQAVGSYAQVTGRTAAEVAAKAQLQIGLCRFEQQRHPEAANALLVVPFTYDYPEWSAWALCEASRAFVEMKQPEQAAKLLARVVKDHPESKWAEVAKERLAGIK